MRIRIVCQNCFHEWDEQWSEFTYENMPTGARMECPKCKKWSGEVNFD